MTVQEIYDEMNRIAPFSTQEKWDNSGLLVGDPSRHVDSVMVALDITCEAVELAAANGCGLIISHHPVIFSPLHNLSPSNPVYQLAAKGIAAICSHTPLDIAPDGINDILVAKFREKIAMTETIESLDAAGCGRIVTLETPMSAAEIASAAKDVLGCQVVRYKDMGRKVRRLGICSGSGASMLEEIAGRCDALLTGDVKHDRWYAAQNLGISLLDCGHYHTEVVMVKALSKILIKRFPGLYVCEWEGGDPVSYV